MNSTINRNLIDLPAASSAALAPSDFAGPNSAAPLASVNPGDNRLGFVGFGIGAVTGIFATGHEAHAAVSMHVTQATGALWSYAQNCPKRMATTSSVGRLRTS